MTQEVKIKCPYCGKVQKATIEFLDVYPGWGDYCHQCEQCGEWITESVWEEVNENE